MKKILITLALLISTKAYPSSCELCETYPYFSLGLGPAPIPVPNFSLGYRKQHIHNGYDIGVNLATAGIFTQARAYANWIHYFNPWIYNEAYFGLGASAGAWFVHSGKAFIAYPNILLGKSYYNRCGSKRFLQAEMNWPVYYSHRHELNWRFPLLTFSYGWGF